MTQKEKSNKTSLIFLGLIIVLLFTTILLFPTSSNNIATNVGGSQRQNDPFLFQCKCVYDRGFSIWPETLTIKLHDWDKAPSYSKREEICTQDCRNITKDPNTAGLL